MVPKPDDTVAFGFKYGRSRQIRIFGIRMLVDIKFNDQLGTLSQTKSAINLSMGT